MTSTPNNPAGRLLNILNECKKVEQLHVTTIMGWSKVLGLGDDVDEIIVMSKIGLVFALPSQIESEILSVKELREETYLNWKKGLFDAFKFINFGSHFNNFTAHLKPELLTSLEFCDAALAQHRPERKVDEKELQKLYESANELYEDVLKADLPPDLSRFILDNIYSIVEAIKDYQITGARGVEHAVNRNFGKGVMNLELSKTVKDHEVGKIYLEILAKAFLTIKTTDAAYTLGTKIGSAIFGLELPG